MESMKAKVESGTLSTLKEENGSLTVGCRMRLPARGLGRPGSPGEGDVLLVTLGSSADSCVLVLDSLILGLHQLLDLGQ